MPTPSIPSSIITPRMRQLVTSEGDILRDGTDIWWIVVVVLLEPSRSTLPAIRGSLPFILCQGLAHVCITRRGIPMPCDHWYARSTSYVSLHPLLIRDEPPVLKRRTVPSLDSYAATPMPTFEITYASPSTPRTPTSYLQDEAWVQTMSEKVKGINTVDVTPDVEQFAESLNKLLEERLTSHIDGDRVDPSKQDHFTLKFTHDNLPPMSALLALSGQLTDDLDCEEADSCLLSALPVEGVHQMMTDELKGLEGCYLYYDKKKGRWVRSGKTSGAANASFEFRGNTHAKNARKTEMMRKMRFHRSYPAEGVQNLGGRKGYFETLDMYCAMGFDRTDDLSAFCPKEADDTVFVWSKDTIKELNKRSGPLKEKQLDMVAYLWELVYDLLLDSRHNVSDSPGFESFGLRVNDKKRKRE